MSRNKYLMNQPAHALIDDTLIIERDDEGRVIGIIARCVCGWESSPHFTSFGASCDFRAHVEDLK